MVVSQWDRNYFLGKEDWPQKGRWELQEKAFTHWDTCRSWQQDISISGHWADEVWRMCIVKWQAWACSYFFFKNLKGPSHQNYFQIRLVLLFGIRKPVWEFSELGLVAPKAMGHIHTATVGVHTHVYIQLYIQLCVHIQLQKKMQLRDQVLFLGTTNIFCRKQRSGYYNLLFKSE